MDRVGLQNSVFDAVYNIGLGRSGLATDGEEHNGRIAYELGLNSAIEIFTEAHSRSDAEFIMAAEYYFLVEELEHCHPDDTASRKSLEAAVNDFSDALNCLSIVSDISLYKKAVGILSTAPKNLISGCPKDIFHQACAAHRTRLNNTLRSPGINMLEKSVLQHRLANLSAAQSAYLELQKRALDLPPTP